MCVCVYYTPIITNTLTRFTKYSVCVCASTRARVWYSRLCWLDRIILCYVGGVLSLTLGVYYVKLGYISNYGKPQF